MSTKRILGITVFAILFIAVLIGVMLMNSFLRRDNDPLQLPDTTVSAVKPGAVESDTLNRVEVTQDTIQAVVSTLSRPEIYSRDIVITSYWEDGQAEYNISVSVFNGVTSLRTLSSSGIEKRIIATPDTLYIWYRGERTPYTGAIGAWGDGNRTSDELQMLVTYEDVINLDKDGITDAGYTEYGDEACIYAIYDTPGLGYTMKYYISIDLGLIICAEEYDETGAPTYSMTAGECAFEVETLAFTLPDGTELLEMEQ